MISDKVKRICRFLKKSQYGYKKPEIFINLTYNCPLRCKFCYVNYQRNRDFDLENLLYLFEEGILQTNYIKLVTFFGGEPLLKIDLIEKVLEQYYNKLVEKGIHIAVITSMSVNVDRQLELIKKYPLYETVISFDNYSEQRVLANQKPFKVLEKLDLSTLQQYHKNICFHTVLSTEKSLDDLMMLQQLFKEYGFVYSWCWDKTPSQVFEFKDKYTAIITQILEENQYYPSMFTKELSHYLNRDNLGCGIGSELFISVDGDISPCSISHHNNEFMLMKNGVIQEDASENIQITERNVFNNGSCQSCHLKGFCNGGCLFERKKNRNDYNSVNPILCEIMKSLYEVYDGLFGKMNIKELEELQIKIRDNYIGNLDYCYNTHINIDMYEYFGLGEN